MILRFLEGVVEVIQGCMKREELSGFALSNQSAAPPMLSQQINQSGVSHANVNVNQGGGHNSFGFNSVQASINATYNNVNSQPVPPPNPHQIANANANANNYNVSFLFLFYCFVYVTTRITHNKKQNSTFLLHNRQEVLPTILKPLITICEKIKHGRCPIKDTDLSWEI